MSTLFEYFLSKDLFFWLRESGPAVLMGTRKENAVAKRHAQFGALLDWFRQYTSKHRGGAFRNGSFEPRPLSLHDCQRPESLQVDNRNEN